MSTDVGASSSDRALDRDVAGYRVVVRSRGVREPGEHEKADARLLARLGEERERLERRIFREAVIKLGPAFVAEIRDVRPGESVAITVGVYALYGGVAALINTLRQFATTLQHAVGEELAELGIDADVVALLDEGAVAAEGEDADLATEPWDRIAPVLGAIGTGIGVLGLVTFVGGAVQFGRLQGAGLPAEDALTILPTENLVVVGARTLVPALVFAIAGVALLYIVRTAPLIRAAVVGPRAGAEAAPEAGDLAVARTTEGEGDRSLVRALVMAALLFGLEVLAFFSTLDARGLLEFVVFIGLAAATVVVFACIAFSTPRFAWLGAATFVAMSVFLTGLAYARARQTSDVRAAAVIRENKRAIIGLYVAETSGRVYLVVLW